METHQLVRGHVMGSTSSTRTEAAAVLLNRKEERSSTAIDHLKGVDTTVMGVVWEYLHVCVHLITD